MNDPKTVGVILAGGQSRRMGGGDKSLLTLGGRSILSRVIGRLQPQCDRVVLNANGDKSRFAAFGLPVVPDTVTGFRGPLAGLLTAFEWTAAHSPGVEWIMSVSADCPFLPSDLVARLHRARADANIAVATSAGQQHHVVMLISAQMRDDLAQSLRGGARGAGDWLARHKVTTADWPTDPIDPFFNINTPGDLAEAERFAASDPETASTSARHD